MSEEPRESGLRIDKLNIISEILLQGNAGLFFTFLVLASASSGQVPEPQVMPIPVETDSAGSVVSDTTKAAAADSAIPATSAKTAVKKEMEKIIVIGHYKNETAAATAASSGTYTSELLEDRPLLRPGEVEELVPGLMVTQHSGAGKANQFLLRGFNLDHGTDFATSVDGMPINLPTQGHGQGYDDLNPVIPELIDHVDFYKGPYIASKGDFASAGAADIFYTKQLARPFLEATIGAYGYYRSIAAASTDLAGGKILMGLEAMHQDGPFVVPQDYCKFNGVLRWSRQLGDGTFNVEAMGYSGQWNATNQVPERAVTEGIIPRFGTLDSSDGGTSDRYSLSTSWNGQLAGGIFSACLYAVKYDMDLFSNFTFFLNDTVNGDQMEQKDNRWFFGTSEAWRKEGTLFGFQEKFQVGLDARCDYIDPVALIHTVKRKRLNDWTVDTVTETKVAPWVDLDSRLLPWMKLYLGLRYDYINNNDRSEDTTNSGSSGAGMLSPKASLTLGPWAKTEFYVDYGEGFHSNDARGTTATIDVKGGGDTISKTAVFSKSRGAEVGVRNESVPGLQSTFALWLLDFSSELVWDADEGAPEPAGATRRMGFELSEHYQPLPWLLFDLDAALSQARFIDPDTAGQYVPEAIESAVSAGISLHKLGPFSASLFMRYFGPRALDQHNSVRSAGSMLFNGQIAWDLNRTVRITLDVFNILNAKVDDMAYYYPTRLRGEPAGGVNDIDFHPAEPVGVRCGLTIKL